MTSYQKLKAENQRLREELATVCLFPDSMRAKTIVVQHKMGKQIEDALWHASPMVNRDGSEFTGFLKAVLQ